MNGDLKNESFLLPRRRGPNRRKLLKEDKRETRVIAVLPGGFVKWRELAKQAGCSLANVVEWLALAPEADPHRKAVIKFAARFCTRQPGEVLSKARQRSRAVVLRAERQGTLGKA